MKVYTEILLSLLTIIIFSIFALRPTLLTIAQLLKDIEGKRTTLSTINLKIKKLSQAQVIFDQQRANVDLLRIAIPNLPSPATLIRQIEGIADKNQIAVNSFALGESSLLGVSSDYPDKTPGSKIPQNTSILPVNLRADVDTDKFQQIYIFLTDIENLRIPIKIYSISLNNTINKDDTKKVSFNISGNFLYQKSK